MLGLLGKQDKSILLINFEGLSVYRLEDNRLMHVAKFSDEDSGYEEFRDYLITRNTAPVTLLVDSVAEEFIVEKTPHVGMFDRNSFLKRKSDQHFRGSEYRSARVVGRDGAGRRDDKVLFSAISKNEAIEPWVKVLLQEEVSITGVTTPAYALCKIVKQFGLLSNETILLVTWEVSGIRQSLIVGERTIFSRLTPLPNDPNTKLSHAIIDSCDQLKTYLDRVGLVNFEDKLDLHIITPHMDDDVFDDEVSTNFRSIQHHNSIDLMEIHTFGGAQKSITAIMLCLDWGVRKGELKNIYAPSTTLRFHQLRQARKMIGLSCLVLLLLGSVMSTPLMLDAVDRRNRIAQVENQISPIQTEYDALTAQFPETPIPSEAMELAVRNFDLISDQANSPLDLLSEISRVVSSQPSIVLNNIDWNMTPLQEDVRFTEALLANESVINVNIYGSLVGSRSIQQSDNQLQQFIDTLGMIEGVVVLPISLPIERRTDAEVSTVLNDDFIDAEFAMNIRMERESG